MKSLIISIDKIKPPKKNRPKYLNPIVSLMEENLEKYFEEARKAYSKSVDKNTKITKDINNLFSRLRGKSSSKDKQFIVSTLNKIERMKRSYTNGSRSMYYKYLGSLVSHNHHTCVPHIDSADTNFVYPGMPFTIYGTCFGTRGQGESYLQINENELTQLNVLSWTDTEITLEVPSELDNELLRPYGNGKVWITSSADGDSSNEFPISF